MPDSRPQDQQRIVEKLKDVGGPSLLVAGLMSSKKRGRYQLRMLFIDGWDAARKEVISPKDSIPDKPWLAVTWVDLISRGRFRYDQNGGIEILVTHHALSRLAQRCNDARKPIDLISAVTNIWAKYAEQSVKHDGERWVTDGYRLTFPLNKTENAVAVLNNYNDGKGGIVFATIIDERSSIPTSPPCNSETPSGQR
jgi:hypothetical protein